ncbi:MAG: HIT family protein [Betaproteobacteria bacterium]|nr:MAG: HIT family protein [Betaproteobacteria bacterium]
MSKPCPFCAEQQALARNEHAFMIYDRWPATRGHTLIVTARHVEDFFKTSRDERQAMLNLVDEAKVLLDEAYAPQGYNIGVNVGETAGQTVMHCHLHVIPRYRGDVPNPRGGIRAVIPGKQSY